MKKPLLICMTPVRNEAWVLHAFLKATSLWADYIIIADQGSIDGSREIALSYKKVVLLDNPALEMHQAQTRQLLFKEARKIKGDKILFALDADEFLSGNFMQSDGWKIIMNSKAGEIFWFRWLNICNSTEYIQGDKWMYWACHYSDEIMNGEYPDNYIHEWRLPYPKSLVSETQINDISFIHFARVSKMRQRNKERFYQVITKIKEPDKSLVSFYRMYHAEIIEKKYPVDKSVYSYYRENGLDLLNEINKSDVGAYYNQQVIQYFNTKGAVYFQGLDIWDKSFLEEHSLKDPRSLWVILIHLYLKSTQNFSKQIIIRVFDKILKKMGV